MTDLSLTIASNNLTTSCLSIVDFEYHFQFLLLAQHHPVYKSNCRGDFIPLKLDMVIFFTRRF